MRKRVVFITGASGFVGSWVQKTLAPLVDAGSVAVLGTDRALDITDAAAVDQQIREARPDAVIHLAAIAAPREAGDKPDLAWDTNVNGTLHVARAILTHSPHTTLIFASSSEVYGRTFTEVDGPLDERALLQPATFYGASKAAADIVLGQLAGDGLRVIRFRPFNHTGPGQSEKFLVPRLAAQIARIEAGLQSPVLTVGNLEVRKDFLDVRDVARAYVESALEPRPDALGAAFNLATAQPMAIGDIVDWFCRHSTADIVVEQDRALLRPGEIPTVSGSYQRASSELGWRPTIVIEETFAQLLDAARSCRVSG